MDVSVIIVNYNTKELLRNCLISIYKQTYDIEFEVIVSDNGSTDGSVEMVKLEFPEITIIENRLNFGFGVANNRSVERACGKYLFFLNSDTILKNNAILIFYNFVKKNSNVIAGCYLQDSHGKVIHSYDKYSTPVKGFIRLMYNSFPFLLKLRFFFTKGKLEINDIKSPLKVQYITGADLFLSREIFCHIGGFDEKYFMYFEDDDLCRRAKLFGYASFIIPGPKIVHLESKSSKNIVKKLSFMEKSYLYYMKKYNNEYIYRFIKYFFIIYAFIRFISPYHKFKEKYFLLKSLNHV
jgi:GT2 family glycosyltransferase